MDNNCKFCGQAVMLDDETLTGKEATEAATLICDCEDGKVYREEHEQAQWKDEKLEIARETIDEKFDRFDGDVRELLFKVSEMVYNNEITKGVVQLNSIVKASIKKVTTKGKDYIRIERTDRVTSSEEV